MSNYKEIKKYYDDYSTWYDKERDKTYYYDFINQIEIDLVKKYGKDKTTLEIGCGTGIILNEVSPLTKKSWGIDLSSGMLEVAQNKGLNVKPANATCIPFKDREFDVVYSFKVLPHIPEISQVINEIHRVLGDKGVAILEFYNPISLKAFTNKLTKATHKVYVRYDSLRNIKILLGKNFDLIDIRGARIITPFAFMLKIPIVSKIIILLEKNLSRTFMNRFAGYFIIIAIKK